MPGTNTDYWKRKIERNVTRDQANVERLTAAGWTIQIIWECEVLPSSEALIKRLRGTAPVVLTASRPQAPLELRRVAERASIYEI